MIVMQIIVDIVIHESDMDVAPSCKKLLKVTLIKQTKNPDGKGDFA